MKTKKGTDTSFTINGVEGFIEHGRYGYYVTLLGGDTVTIELDEHLKAGIVAQVKEYLDRNPIDPDKAQAAIEKRNAFLATS